jgi:cell division protein FtsN
MPQPLMLLYASKDTTHHAEPAATESIPADSSVEATAFVRFYQVGAYRKIVNAENANKKLISIGLDAYTTHNKSSDLFIVYVSAGTDPAKTMLTLKDAGYEAWPLDAAP